MASRPLYGDQIKSEQLPHTKSLADSVFESSLFIRTSERTTSNRQTSDYSYTTVLDYVERTVPPRHRILRLLDSFLVSELPQGSSAVSLTCGLGLDRPVDLNSTCVDL